MQLFYACFAECTPFYHICIVNLINKAAVCAPLCAEQLNLVITLTKCRINSFGKKTASIA